VVVSWVVAVLFAPLLGVTMLPAKWKHTDGEPGRLRRAFLTVLGAAMRFRWVTIAATVLLFGVSVWAMRFVENPFFPASDRPELIMDVTLPQNTTFAETTLQIDRLEAALQGDEDALFHTTYIGRGAPRFLLSFDPATPGPNLGQIVIQTPSLEARDRLKIRLEALVASDFAGIDVFVKYLEIGPPVGRPVQYRLAGPDIDIVRDRARDLAALLGQDKRLTGIVLDWSEPSRVVRVDIVQDKARQLGITASDISSALNVVYAGSTLTQLRDDTYLIDIVTRGDSAVRGSIEALQTLQIEGPTGVGIPLGAIATFSPDIEQPVVHIRNRLPTVTVKAAISTADQPDTLATDLAPAIAGFSASLPDGYTAEVGRSVESSGESQAPILAVVPLMLVTMLALTMIQMQGFRLTFVVICAAPLALIGVVAALLPSGAPLGFVAILGVLALLGILIRNSIILVHEIEHLGETGMEAWLAVTTATNSRARPILLTAAAASLALIPISRQVFWGPMAFAMMGIIIVGTAITLVFMPALYVAVFRVKPPSPLSAEPTGAV